MKNSLSVILFLALIGCSKTEEPYLVDYISIESSDRDYEFMINSRVPFANIYFKYDFGDQLSMIMDSDDNYTFSIYLQSIDIFQQSLPYQFPNSTDIVFAELTLRNHSIPFDGQMYGPGDDANFIGNTENGMIVIITEYKNGFLIGNFKGVITTGTGRQQTIENGEFQIEIKIENGV